MTSLNNPLTDVSKLNVDELLTVFKTLEAPDLAEMNGEYTATLLKQRSLFVTVAGLIIVSNPIAPGKWLCKAFRPVNDTSGRGYNTFQHFGRVVQQTQHPVSANDPAASRRLYGASLAASNCALNTGGCKNGARRLAQTLRFKRGEHAGLGG